MGLIVNPIQQGSRSASFSQRGSPPGNSRRKIKQEQDRLKKNRKLVDHYLKKSRGLRLQEQGMAYFSHKRFIVAVEVPSNCPGTLYIYTMVSRLDTPDQTVELNVLRLAMELNYMTLATQGATLGIEGDEINLCYSLPIQGMSANDFDRILNDFVCTADEVHARLASIAATPKGRQRMETR